MAANNREIERKFLLRALPPEVSGASAVEIDQGYLPGERILERIRRVTNVTNVTNVTSVTNVTNVTNVAGASNAGGAAVRYYRTVKLGTGVERFEFEEETTELFFTTVWPLTRGRRVQKRRYTVHAGADEWEIDEFLDRALVLAEIELERADQPVRPPAWLAAVINRDVTEENGYTNFALAR
jgi:CYTH domain-containing protein